MAKEAAEPRQFFGGVYRSGCISHHHLQNKLLANAEWAAG
jgi:hypothetical protein